MCVYVAVLSFFSQSLVSFLDESSSRSPFLCLSVEPVSLFYKFPDCRAVCGWKQTNQLETSPTEREGRQVTEEEATLNDTTTDERIQETDVVCIYSLSAATAQLRMYRREEFPFISFRYLLLYSFIIKRDLLKRN